MFTFADPTFETRLLVHNDKIYSVQNNKFIEQQYDEQVIQDLLEKAGAKIKPSSDDNGKKLNKINNLVGKRSFTGIRDCRSLEV